MKKYIAFIALICLLLSTSITFANYKVIDQPDVQAYLNSLAEKYQFDRHKLEKLFSTVVINEEVGAKVKKPMEALPWYKYKKILLTHERLRKGLTYWQKHAQTLEQVEKAYGVPASVIVAIIGVETQYGEHKGSYPVFNTLATLAFNHNPRHNFFRSELTQYLLLTRDNQLAPLNLKGSYAGAVGIPQFMPSSYREYAVDYGNKGYANLFENHGDAIASVANYLKKHGWKSDEPVTIAATYQGDSYADLITKNLKPIYTQAEIEQHHVIPEKGLQGRKVAVFNLEDDDGIQVWLGLQNFHTIATYNNSRLYCMAVNELAKQLRQEKYHSLEKPRVSFSEGGIEQ